MTDLKLLHRQPGTRVFFTTDDPSVHYDLTCGGCDFPITASDECCPRCQEELERCPVCSDSSHTRAPRGEPRDESNGSRQCAVCGVKRVPFGDLRLSALEGSFCSNIYGCAAGGLLLQTNEFAVLPKNASVCPVCRDSELTPFDVATFAYHVSYCAFCGTCFRPASDWAQGWGEGHNNLDSIAVPVAGRNGACALCGRDEEPHYAGADGGRVAARDEPDMRRASVPPASQEVGSAPPDAPLAIKGHVQSGDGRVSTCLIERASYLRMAELGRLFILENCDERVFDAAFRLWFDPNPRLSDVPDQMTIDSLVTQLVEGTRKEPVRKVLVRRTARFLQQWDRRLTRNYPIKSKAYRGL